MNKIKRNHIYLGSCLSILKTLPDESVDMCITSPPYWNLRNYGSNPEIWGGDENCDHEWTNKVPFKGSKPSHGIGSDSIAIGKVTEESQELGWSSGEFCTKCNAWKGELGLEPTPELYIEHLTMIFHEVRRVLKSYGTCWVNIGDTYASTSGGFGHSEHKGLHKQSEGLDEATDFLRPNPKSYGYKDKDLIGIPWMLAFSMRAEGWYLRQDIIWAKALSGDLRKGTAMPESIKDRCSKSHEYLFLFAKERHYYYDYHAVTEPLLTDVEKEKRKGKKGNQGGFRCDMEDRPREDYIPKNGKGNRRSVWYVQLQQFKDAHFACFPKTLITPAIKAGCPVKICSHCGKPYEREVVMTKKSDRPVSKVKDFNENGVSRTTDNLKEYGEYGGNEYKDKGYQPICDCEQLAEPLKGVVLDPFMGSGTTGEVAKELSRDYVGLEINEKYIKIANKRITGVKPRLF